MPPDPIQTQGKVFLVGAGPGDPGYITLRGVECLKRADVVLYDYLVNPRILLHAERASCVCLGRHGKTRIWRQDEINERLVELARQGKVVVRLKGGDPAVFARGAEETEVLTHHGIPFEIVPGITAALAAGSCAGIPLTHRDLASAVALVTGQENLEKPDAAVDYEALAKFPGTIVFYMGVTTAPRWTAALMAAGMSPNTPSAIVRRCSFPDQQSIRCTLGEVAGQLAGSPRVRPPVIVIVGEVAGLPAGGSWFEQRPLFGRKILVTRPRHQAESLAAPLRELGADVLSQPAIEIADPRDWSAVDTAITAVGTFDWVVFSSANGVQSFLRRLLQVGKDVRALAGNKLATIGPGTAQELAEWHLRADLLPGEFRAEALAAALAASAPGKRFLLVRASRGREVLAERLRDAGGHVEQIVVYTSRDVTAADPEIVRLLEDGAIDWVTVTSSAIARSLAGLFGERLERCRLASISPVTSETLRELGLEPAVEATRYTMDGVVEAILAATCSEGRPAI